MGNKRKCDFINADKLLAKNHAEGNAGQKWAGEAVFVVHMLALTPGQRCDESLLCCCRNRGRPYES